MATSTSPSPDTVPARHYAAMLVAVGTLRGELYGVLGGEFDKESIQRLLDSTSITAIAKVFGEEEDDLFVDSDLYLSEREKLAIGGIRG
jgi:hypothetical protein